ncbi:MAG TPA: DISARM system phospholipase D-like protein DrmC [Streptosporangiaceae bacterium]
MSPARRRHGITGQDRRQAHIDWLKLIEVSGPFLSVPVLTAEWPDLEPLDTKARDRLRQEHRQWQEHPAANRSDWIGYVLGDLLGWQDAVQRTDLGRLTLDVPEHEAAITPSFVLTDPTTSDLRLLGLISDDFPVARIEGSDWPATPADRLAQLCRHHGVELGLATDGRWWAVVWAPTGGVTTVAVFDAISWPDLSERTVLRAFISLLQRRRFFAVPPERQLPALLRESLNNQEEITDRLGIQVRQAVELLVAAFGRGDIGADVTAYEVYRGAVAVMMRIVFLLFAEESGLLPADNELYARAYSAGGLYTELEQRVADARGNEGELEDTFLAWHRLLALFTVVYRGVSHPELDLIAHDGSLFDPDAHPWLPLTVDDRTVLHMLRAVQTVTIGGELRTVSFRTLTVEQIGYVYEGLLSFEGLRAAETVVGLIGKDGREEEVPLKTLESTAAAHSSPETLAAKLADLYKDSGIGSPRALTVKLAPLTGDERAQAETRLYAVTRDHPLDAWPRDAILRATPGAETLLDALAGVDRSAGLAYLTGLAAGYAQRAGEVSVETVWSGPASHHVPVRATAAVLADVVCEARHELLLMTYSAQPYRPLSDALGAAVSRGVVVSVVVETLQGAGSALSGDEPCHAFSGVPGVELWHWPTSQRIEPGAKMHAKLAVADRRVLLVTSANLTQSGVAKNIEAGLLIRGGNAPQRTAEHVDALRASGNLVRLN